MPFGLTPNFWTTRNLLKNARCFILCGTGRGVWAPGAVFYSVLRAPGAVFYSVLRAPGAVFYTVLRAPGAVFYSVLRARGAVFYSEK